MTLPPEILEGFKAEAASYLDEIRHTLTQASEDGADRATINALYAKLDVVSGSAALLEMDAVVEAADPVLQHLAAYEGETSPPDDLLREVRGVVQQVADLLGMPTDEAIPDQPPPDDEKPAAPAALAGLPPELVAIFQNEAEEHQQTIQQGVGQLADNPGDLATMRDVRRAAHTLKGASASVGFKQLADVTHTLEDVLDEAIEGQQALSGAALKLMADIAYAVEEFIVPTGAATDDLLTRIDQQAAALSAEAPTAQPARAPSTDEPAPHQQRGEAAVRLPISTIDTLIDHLGEVIINHGAFGEQMRSLRTLLSDLGTSSQRLQRLAEALDAQIERQSLNLITQRAEQHSEFDSIELDRYSAFYQLARELEETAADARDINTQLDVLTQELNASLTRERRLASAIQEGLVNTKLMTFEEIVPRLRRLVQHTADDLGLVVTFTVTGADTRVDKTILDALLEPLTHLLRNAISHGLEDPTTRLDAGKPAHGTIKLAVSRDRGRIVITLSDDGRGLDLDAIYQQAQRLDLLPPEATPTDDEIINLIFVDGFSTAQTVTQTAGRGVGMNIVRRSVHNLQGTARVNTSAGRGTTFTLSIPVSLAIIRALFFACRGIGYAAPLEQVSTVLRLDEAALATVDDDDTLTYDGQRYRVLDLGTFTDPDRLYSTAAGAPQRRYGLVIDLGEYQAAVLVDGLAGIRDTVVKSLGNHLRRVHGVSGATISGDGQVSLILDLLEVASGHPGESAAPPPRLTHHPTPGDALHVLVVDDSPSVRRVVGRFLESVGWQVTTARDGLDALDKLAMRRPNVALVDIEMPRMNGYELLGAIKGDDALSGLPVVFLTSRSAGKHRTRAEALGVDGYLVKPYQEEELVQTLRAVTRRAPA